jgi:hypothetical protein
MLDRFFVRRGEWRSIALPHGFLCSFPRGNELLPTASKMLCGVREVPVVGATLNAVMQQARQRAVVLCARQRGKSEQRRQWDLCAAWH